MTTIKCNHLFCFYCFNGECTAEEVDFESYMDTDYSFKIKCKTAFMDSDRRFLSDIVKDMIEGAKQ